MRFPRFIPGRLPAALLVGIFAFALSASAARANGVPADVCSLISPQDLQNVFSEPFGAAVKTTAPAAYRGQSSGTNCRFTDQKGGSQVVVLIVYVDKSPDEAKQTFEKLSAFFPPTSKTSGVGDEGYIDNNHAIHILKGSVRFFINAPGSSNSVRDKHAHDLAVSVAAQL
jgi:hypothetical protein